MTGAQRMGVMRSSGHFAAWPDDALAGALGFFDEVRVPAGERLATEGTLCHEFVIVAEGLLEARSSSLLSKLGPGDSFGWSAMTARGRNEATVVAATDAVLLVMSHEQFRGATLPRRRSALWARHFAHNDPMRKRDALRKVPQSS
jgi:CRP-like cAMP-binding protein